MKEVEVRKFHRILGIIVVWFLAGQTLTGLILSIGGLAPGGSPTWLDSILSTLHFGWNPLGGMYRTLLALAVFAQGISGIIIYFLMRARSRKV
ncbi:MAG: hypothetical protein HY790_06815 [Deltaproteobacteria bacterium]|nr:hypothetical protein [Deltaproteobacteria bacterium]MBI4795536.1 hypothetical protein [Deltaproteobacteria bacterium]